MTSISFPGRLRALLALLGLTAAAHLAVAGAVPAGDAAVAPPAFTLVDLGTLGGSFASPAAINNQRQVVGRSWRNDSPECLGVEQSQPCEYAFLWQGGVMTDLGHATPAGLRTFPTRIDRDGGFAGYEEVPAVGGGGAQPIVAKPFVYRQGAYALLPLLSTDVDASGLAYGMNGAGVITGFSEEQNLAQTLVTWSDGAIARGTVTKHVYRRGQGINDAGTIVGWQYMPRSFRPNNGFVQVGGVVVNLSAADTNIWSEAMDINNDGLVVGNRADRAFASGLAAAWSSVNGRWVGRTIGALPGHNHSGLTKVNRRGDAVGFSEDQLTLGSLRAIAVIDGRLVDLTAATKPGHGIVLRTATGINDRGDIVGEASVGDGPTRAFLLLRR